MLSMSLLLMTGPSSVLFVLFTHWLLLLLPTESFVVPSLGSSSLSSQSYARRTTTITTSNVLHLDHRSSRAAGRRVIVVTMGLSNPQQDSDTDRSTSTSGDSEKQQQQRLPQLVIFDLDGCLWRPEMYELLYFSGGGGAPFTRPLPSSTTTTTKEGEEEVEVKDDPNGITTLLSCKGEPVYLLGNVPEVMRELHLDPKWNHVRVGISSRTNEPNWARELLQEFKITTTTTTISSQKDRRQSTTNEKDDNVEQQQQERSYFSLAEVFQDGPIEMSSDSKVNHFLRISSMTGIPLSEMLFFDNEYGNCQMVAQLGVTVAYCPNNQGVDFKIWNAAVNGFPSSPIGQIIQI